MRTDRFRSWEDALVLTRDHTRIGDHSSVGRAALQGGLVRVSAGAYLPAASWGALDPDARFLARIAANSLLYPRDQPYSHLSAAALWGLPMIGSWPRSLEVLVRPDAGVGSRRSVIRHPGPPDPTECTIDNHRVTSLARTVIDVARTQPIQVGVAMADHAIRTRRGSGIGSPVSAEELLVELERLRGARGVVRARKVVEFADGRAQSAVESVSRWALHALGFPAPDLQCRFDDGDGLIGFTDFGWRSAGIVGEFDGIAKYVREELRNGQTVDQVVLAEKRREDRLRRQVRAVARWGWRDAMQPRRLEHLLLHAGLVRGSIPTRVFPHPT